jgi:hypothetical protein
MVTTLDKNKYIYTNAVDYKLEIFYNAVNFELVFTVIDYINKANILQFVNQNEKVKYTQFDNGFSLVFPDRLYMIRFLLDILDFPKLNIKIINNDIDNNCFKTTFYQISQKY